MYLETCRNLFETYVRFTEPLRTHVRKQMPRDPEISQAAYDRSVRARGFDIIRGLLPSATLTNMGVFDSEVAFVESCAIALLHRNSKSLRTYTALVSRTKH